MAVQVFNVLTEFRFEVGSALLGTERLQSAVQGVSSAADSALVSFQRLGAGIVAHLGLGEGGLLALLTKSITSFDKFTQSQIAFANIFATTGRPFEERMEAAKELIEDMNKQANKFGLPVEDLVTFTKLITPILANKGLAGPGMKTAVDISRNLLKSSPTLGIDPGLVQGQLMRMIEGQASMGDTLFVRLTSDTKAMKEFMSNSKKFNALDEATRVAKIGAALNEFANDTKVLEANANTLAGQFQTLKNNLLGMASVLKPLGEALMQPILIVMRGLNKFIVNEGAGIIKGLARAIEPWIKSPERFLATLRQLSKLDANVTSVSKIFGTVGAIFALQHALVGLGISIPYVSAALGAVVTIVTKIGKDLFVLGPKFGGVINSVVVFLSRLFVPMLLLVGLFQLISKAIAFARIRDAEKLLELGPRIAEIGARFSRILEVFADGFDKFAELISPFFRFSMLMEFLTNVFETVSVALTLVLAGFQGFVFAVLEEANQFASFFTGGGFSLSAIGDAFSAGVDQMIERILGKVDSGGGALANMTQNIAKVEIRQDFKEQQEPDRIAFTIVDQLKKVGQNPTQRRGASLASATLGA